MLLTNATQRCTSLSDEGDVHPVPGAAVPGVVRL